MSAKTVFISYRRDSSGKPFARLLEQALTHQGYDVFLDVDDIDAGKWADQILTEVPARAHFLLLLTPGALDRCADQYDWVRREFELAVQSKRNIVPVREESVDLGKLQKGCPESMKGIFDLQIATVQHSAFERDVETLVERYIPPHKAPSNDAETAECVVSPTRLHHGADHLFGREAELAALVQIANDPAKKVLTIVAFGGVGKTSLAIEWMGRLAAKNWEGFERVFDWSFFSQGTREQGAASAEGFVAEALRFFGDEAMAQSAASAWDKGARLAQLVAQRRTLLILDGVEPLQHPPGPLAGELKDPALATLLKGLARSNSGLCIVTTRERVADLAPFRDTTAPEWQLHHLSVPAGIELLKTLGVRGTAAESEQLVEGVKGHALTLNLLGRYLAKAHGGDIRKSDQVKFEKADAATQGGYAFKTIGAYERWLNEGGKDGARQLAVLRLLGLFDRPADAGCLQALRREPAIAGLTEPLIGLDGDDWNLTISSLTDCGLATVQSDEPEIRNSQFAIDAHPLIREYFAKQLREKKPESWRGAHRRLYEHLCETTPDKPQPTLEDLQPLYQAVAHGCQAGLQQAACDKVYFARIKRQTENYSSAKLGAFGSELGAIACFFETPWSRVSPALTEADQAWTLGQSAFYLRALGRLTEALEPMKATVELYKKQGHWTQAGQAASNLSEMELTLGEVAGAVADAEQSVTYADRSGDAFERMTKRATHANALHQADHRARAKARFREAEEMWAKTYPHSPLMSSAPGFQYCDLLLAAHERTTWYMICSGSLRPPEGTDAHRATLQLVSQRAAETLKIAERNHWLLDIALDHLTLGRAALYAAIISTGSSRREEAHSKTRTPNTGSGNESQSLLPSAAKQIDAAVAGLRSSGNIDELVRGRLTRAWLRSLTGEHTGPESAQTDLDEAWEIAERGPMKLFMADIHLYRARLFHSVKPYPWTSPQEDLAAARKLIEQCGYWRRKEELEDAEAAAKNW
jgi:tetratricopeptide (TPR) repeat protein